MSPHATFAIRRERDRGTAISLCLSDASLVLAVALVASAAGILTRQAGFLAAFWPANAILLGMLVRTPRLARAWCWPAAFAGFMLAQLLTDDGVPLSLWLTFGNLAGVAAGCAAFQWVQEPDRRLQRPFSILSVAGACAVGAAAAAVTGAWIGLNWFGQSSEQAALTWFASELANSLAIVPVILAAPAIRGVRELGRALAGPEPRASAALLGLLVLSLVIGAVVGGPAAIAFPVPALLLCALRGDVFQTTLLTLLSTAWTMIEIVSGHFLLLDELPTRPTILSVQIGLSLIAMGPIAVSANLAARDEALRRLRRRASRDGLTDALTRAAFLEQSEPVLGRLALERRPVAVLMLDVDHFKQVNDSYGHAAGDAVLTEFGRMVARCLRDTDVFGRIGGEEFAVVLPGVAAESAAAIAERIRELFEAGSVELEDGAAVQATVSIGVAHAEVAPPHLDATLALADRALYEAKRGGRNRCVAVRLGGR